jgi:hemolysin activation/secretion protein
VGASLEGAGGTFDYGRGSIDASVSRGVGERWALSMTASAGTSVGTVPPQRMWYLGGTQTVRGQVMGAQGGNAYWFTRSELAYGLVSVRPTVFFDLGWAGPRGDWTSPGRAISGAGVGVSLLDGLLHVDLAHGIQPSRSWRGAMYLDVHQ